MKTDYTHITVILDRSGSMEEIRDDTIGGFNAFLASQKAEPGEMTLTLVQFDSQNPYEVIHKFKPIAEVRELNREMFVPRGSTPLLDAMGMGMNDLEMRLAQMPEADRPERVVMVIVTDGEENASREFRKDQIEKMIRHHQDADVWQFIFLSADLKAIMDAHDYGVAHDSTMAFNKTSRGNAQMWASTSAQVSDFRQKRTNRVAFTDEDRRNQEEPDTEGGNGQSS